MYPPQSVVEMVHRRIYVLLQPLMLPRRDSRRCSFCPPWPSFPPPYPVLDISFCSGVSPSGILNWWIFSFICFLSEFCPMFLAVSIILFSLFWIPGSPVSLNVRWKLLISYSSRFSSRAGKQFLSSSWNAAFISGTLSLAASILFALSSALLGLCSLIASVAISSWWSVPTSAPLRISRLGVSSSTCCWWRDQSACDLTSCDSNSWSACCSWSYKPSFCASSASSMGT